MTYGTFLVQLLGPVSANIGAFLLMTLACYGAGRWTVRKLLPQLTGHELLLSLVSGGSLWALAGLIGGNGLLALPLWAAALLPGMAAVWGIWELYRAGSPLPRLKEMWEIFAVLVALGGWFFASAQLLPYSWDEQTYQLAVPVQWLQSGSIAPVADLPYSAFPMLPQFLWLWMLKLGGLGTGRLLILGAFLLLFYGLYRELRRCTGFWIAGGLTMLLILSPLSGAMIREFYAEVFLALLMLGAVRILRKTDDPDGRTMVMLGLFAGSAAAVKLTGLGVSFAIFAMLLYFRPGWKSLGYFAGGGAVFFAFYLRPWIALGNPVYPFAGGLFGTPGAVVEAYHSAMGESNYGPGKWSGGLLGWLFSGYDEMIYDGIVLGYAFPVIFAGCAIGCYLLLRQKKGSFFLRQLGAGTAVLYLFWAVTSQQTRFLLPLVPVLLLLAAVLLNHLPRRAGMAMVILLLILGGVSVDVWAWKHGFYCWKFLEDARTRPLRLLTGATREEGLMHAYNYLASHTPQDTGVLLVFERRGLYCPRPHRNGSPGFQDWFDFTKHPDWIGELQKRNIRYLLVAASRKNPDVQEAFLAYDQAFADAVYQGMRTGRLRVIPEASREVFLLIRIQ